MEAIQRGQATALPASGSYFSARAHGSSAWMQFKVLARKNWLLATRNWKAALAQLGTPALIVVILVFCQMAADAVLTTSTEFPAPQPVGELQPCNKAYGPCRTVVYSPPETPWVEALMRNVSRDAGLDFDEHFKPLPKHSTATGICYRNNITRPCHESLMKGNCLPCALLADNYTLAEYILAKPNETQNAVLFTDAYLNPTQVTLPNEVGYLMLYNATITQFPTFGNNHAMELKRAIERTLLRVQTGQPDAQLDVTWTPFPTAPPRLDGFDVSGAAGGLWFYLPPMITFFIVLTEVVMEKEQRLRVGLRMMGARNSMFWLTWLLHGAMFNALSSLVLVSAGNIAGFSYFRNSNFAVVFLLFFLFGLAQTFLAFLISTLVSTAKTAQTVGYSFILLGFVFQAMLCAGYGMIVDLMYIASQPVWMQLVRAAFFFYPPFHMSKMYYDITVRAANTIDLKSATIRHGPGFAWKDLYLPREKVFFGLKLEIPPPVNTLYTFLASCLLFGVLTWYLDNVLPGEHGSPLPWNFPFTADYWGFGADDGRSTKRRRKSSAAGGADGDDSGDDGAGVGGGGGGGADGEKASLVADFDKLTLRVEEEVDEDVAKEALLAASDSPAADVAVRVHNLTKLYRKAGAGPTGKGVLAVDRLSLTMRRGEILCLLGHNGAGKTTTINMLTGLFTPTSGDATLFGHSLRDDVNRIRKIIGVCPQHDVLWNELTAREHLRMFALLKGVAPGVVELEVEDKLARVGLTVVGDQPAGGFSGGMKRRLSVAIASIGSPKVIFLDEPTTGMDPVNRRDAWELIQRMKKDHVVVLTTHSMEEADTLGDKIGIMAYGRLKCVGNPLHLKNKFGSGYRVTLVTHSSRVARVKAIVRDKLPAAVFQSNDAGNLSFVLPFDQLDSLAPLLSWLEDMEGDKAALVSEWGVSHPTLEEVFLKVTGSSNFTYDALEETAAALGDADESKSGDKEDIVAAAAAAAAAAADSDDEGMSMSASVDGAAGMTVPLTSGADAGAKAASLQEARRAARVSYAYRALFRKNASLQLRQTGSNICQIMTPIMVLGLLVLLQWVMRKALGGTTIHVPEVPWELNGNIYSRDGDGYGQCLEFFYLSDQTDGQRAGYITADGDARGLMRLLPQRNCTLGTGELVRIPYTVPKASPRAVDAAIYHDLQALSKVPIENVTHEPYPGDLLPDGAMNFFKLQADGKVKALDYSFTVNQNYITRYHRANNFSRVGVHNFTPPALLLPFNVQPSPLVLDIQSQLALMELVHRAFFMEAGLLNNDTQSFVNYQLGAKFVANMPETVQSDLSVVVEIVGAWLYPLALTMQLPVFLFIVVMEKELRLREMQKSMGMPLGAYFIVNYVFNFALYAVVAAFFWGVGAALKLRVFSQTNFWLMLLVLEGWGQALVSSAFALASLISSRRSATVLGYVVALLGTAMGILFSDGIYGNIPNISTGKQMPSWMLLLPQFALTRGMYLMNFDCNAKLHCMGSPAMYGWGDEIIRVIVGLHVSAVLLLLLSLYLDAVLPRQYGVPKHPLFCLLPESVLRSKELADVPAVDSIASRGTDCDKDVQAEAHRVAAALDTQDCPAVLHNLRKVFPRSRASAKIAVNRFSLAINRGECFGLLGENGAGKTTLMNMLTGVFPPTSGSATVGGFDIRTEIDKVHLVIGVCPQHDVLWETLTCKEHLLFYSRIKGVPPAEEEAHVRQALREVGLYKFRDRLSSELSGGMQRRLSIAIALVGYSEIVFLDEPTTGLDPASRRHIWAILDRAKAGRALVLTTHAMDEAELLCTRIGIVTHGKMRCVGSQQHLKSQYGGGYRLHLNFSEDCERRVIALMRELFPTATESARLAGTMSYLIPSDSCHASEVFALMQERAESAGITDWAVSQVGLDDVFQHIVHSWSHDDPDKLAMSARSPSRLLPRTPSSLTT